MGVTLWNPEAGGQVDGWGWCLFWCYPHLHCAYLWWLGEGETELQQGCWLTKLAQGRGDESGI